MAILTNRHRELLREVTNLGWLLRHAGDIESFEIYPRYGQRLTTGGCYMIATLRHELPLNGVDVGPMGAIKHYETTWEDHGVCLDFLVRPNFIGVPLKWFGLPTEVPSRKPSAGVPVRMVDPTLHRTRGET